MPDQVIHVCSCGFEYTEPAWRSLKIVGVMSDGRGGRLELRLCNNCQSTRAVPLVSAVAS